MRLQTWADPGRSCRHTSEADAEPPTRTSANSCFPKRSRPALPEGTRHPGIVPTFPELVVMSCAQELNRRWWLRQCNSYTVRLTHSSRLPGSLTKPEGLQSLTGENPIMSPRIIPDFNEEIVIPEQKSSKHGEADDLEQQRSLPSN